MVILSKKNTILKTAQQLDRNRRKRYTHTSLIKNILYGLIEREIHLKKK